MKSTKWIWLGALAFVAALLSFPLLVQGSPQSFRSRGRGKDSYKRPTAENALAFLKTLPPVGRKVNGKPAMVNEFADKTVADIKSMKTVAPGGHIKGGAHLHLNGDDWKYFTAFESLEVANLWEMGGADDKAFYHLGHLSQTVTRIFVETAEVTDKGVKPLVNLKNLKFLGIGWTKTITDGVLKNMSEIKSLEEINVSGCPGIRGPGLKYLSKLKNLKKLHINWPGFDDRSLQLLAPTSIEELNMSKPRGKQASRHPFRITFAGLKTLLSNRRAVRNLKVLNVKGALSQQQADELQKLRPGLKVIR